MDEAAKRVTGVIDELQKTQDDFWVDLPMKAGAGAAVGLTFGILAKKIVKIRTSVLSGTMLGSGMAVERYSQQLSAPYVQPPTCQIDIAAKSPIFADTLQGNIPDAILKLFESAPAAEPTA